MSEVQENAPWPQQCSVDDKRKCGCGCDGSRCWSSTVRRFYSAKGFLSFLSIYIFFQSLVASGYTAAVATSIEQRYSFTATEIGAIVASCDIGSLSTVVFVSWLGGTGNRPRWVAVGGLFVAFGSAIFTLPQWISGEYEPSGSDPNNLANDLCSSNQSSSDVDCLAGRKDTTAVYLAVFIIANLIVGMGSSPIYTLGTTYVDDAAPRRSAPVYVSIVYLIGAIGPAAGYILGGNVLGHWVDPFVTDPPVEEGDSRWVGQWWMGFIISSILIGLSALPLFLFKKEPPRYVERLQLDSSENSELNEELINNSTTSSQMSFGGSITELPCILYRQICNPVFSLVTLSMCCEFTIVVAFLTYMPKYLQDQFTIDASISAIICGGILLPAAGIGILGGGFLIRRFNLSMGGCSKMAFTTSSLSAVLMIPVFFFKCGNAPIAGVTVDYPLQNDSISPRGHLPLANCNADCDCSGIYQPICFDDVSYTNPCLAGCAAALNGTFGDCACLPIMPDDFSGDIVVGACEKDCVNMLAPFLIMVFIITMITASAQTPAIMITLRCVEDDERPLAMGVQYLVLRLLAYIPAPIYFGSVIDKACILWDNSSSCTGRKGACAVYSPDEFRHIYFGLAISVKCLAAIVTFSLMMVIRAKQSRKGLDDDLTTPSLPTSEE